MSANGRSDRIRTCDPLTPSQVRYQAAPRSDAGRSGLIERPPGHGNRQSRVTPEGVRMETRIAEAPRRAIRAYGRDGWRVIEDGEQVEA